MSAVLTLPRLGETMEQGRVVAWLKQPGDAFRRGEIIAEVETDKTVVELPALAEGILREIVAPAGSDVAVGDALCRYEPASGGTRPATPAREAAARQDEAASVAPPASTVQAAPGERLRATPVARRIARQHGVDLAVIQGSGRRARIEARDVEAALARPSGSSSDALYRVLAQGRMAYREWGAGQGRATVLLHGFAGDAQTWALFARLLARQGRRVIAPDLPGHGATEIEAGTLDAVADAVVAFVEGLDLGEIDLVGHSLGGAAAARAARRLGHRIGRLTLIAPAGLGPEIDADFVGGMAKALAGGELATLLARIAQRPPVLSADQFQAMAATLGGRGRLAALADALVADGGQRVSIVGDLAAFTGETRVVWGLDDRIIPWTQATRAGSRVAVHFIADAGHMPQWDQPQELAALFA